MSCSFPGSISRPFLYAAKACGARQGERHGARWVAQSHSPHHSCEARASPRPGASSPSPSRASAPRSAAQQGAGVSGRGRRRSQLPAAGGACLLSIRKRLRELGKRSLVRGKAVRHARTATSARRLALAARQATASPPEGPGRACAAERLLYSTWLLGSSAIASVKWPTASCMRPALNAALPSACAAARRHKPQAVVSARPGDA